MIIAYNNSFKDYNIEYGHFSLDEEIHQSFKKKLTQYGVSMEDMYYADVPIVRKKEINGLTEGTIRHTIVKEATVIGTLRASGYTKGELLLH